jgi:hypothetical protein
MHLEPLEVYPIDGGGGLASVEELDFARVKASHALDVVVDLLALAAHKLTR